MLWLLLPSPAGDFKGLGEEAGGEFEEEKGEEREEARLGGGEVAGEGLEEAIRVDLLGEVWVGGSAVEAEECGRG